MVALTIIQADLAERTCDLIVLKCFEELTGVDYRIATAAGFTGKVAKGRFEVVPGRDTAATSVAIIGVGPVGEFDYGDLRRFGRRAIELTKEIGQPVRRVCIPLHARGYGLDSKEAFFCFIAGMSDAIVDGAAATGLTEIEIVEVKESRAQQFGQFLQSLEPGAFENIVGNPATDISSKSFFSDAMRRKMEHFGERSDRKPRIFTAMAYRDELFDEWEISIKEACHACGLLVERLDQEAFVGDVVGEIRKRIETYDGLIGVINGASPNVFVEVGYAWARDKPIILLVKDSADMPFDLRGQRCLVYRNISDLRQKLSNELKELMTRGTIGKPHTKKRNEQAVDK